ncbi:MAG: acyltransferase [Bacteroidales bacterium]|nr:acyltransferase [Bacteroidales bacterium]
MKDKRIQIFRAAAIIAVVLIHTTPGGMCQVFFKPFINFAVATFLFLSGYLTKNENDDWLAFYRKRITRVLVPYIIWTILYSIPDLRSEGPAGLLKNMLSANAATTLYYIFVYIQFVLLTPLSCRMARSRYRYIGWLVTPISVIIFKYISVFGDMPMGKHLQLLWSDACLGWFTFYYLGLILGNGLTGRRFKLRNLVFLYCASLLLQIAEGYLWFTTDPAGCGSQLKLSSILSSSIFMLIIHNVLENRTPRMSCRTLEIIGDYSFGIYLSHMMVLKGLEATSIYNVIPFPITSLIVLLISFAFCYVSTLVIGKKAGRWIGFI